MHAEKRPTLNVQVRGQKSDFVYFARSRMEPQGASDIDGLSREAETSGSE